MAGRHFYLATPDGEDVITPDGALILVYTLPGTGLTSVTLSSKAPTVTFEDQEPTIDFSAKKPTIEFS
jgi:hypothetical protein